IRPPHAERAGDRRPGPQRSGRTPLRRPRPRRVAGDDGARAVNGPDRAERSPGAVDGCRVDARRPRGRGKAHLEALDVRGPPRGDLRPRLPENRGKSALEFRVGVGHRPIMPLPSGPVTNVARAVSEAPFVHLHVHSEYSILDGACRIPDLVARAAEFQMPAVALTDHGSLAGAVELTKEADKHGIKPVIGCEVYVADDRHAQTKGYAHLTLLAADNAGYSNLIKLSSLGYLEGYYYKPRVDWELLDRHSSGLIALSASL